MLFNSFEFILGFLPICLIGYFLIARWSDRAALVWLVLCSLFFYGWWNVKFVPLITASILGNFFLAELITRYRGRRAATAKAALVIGIAGNLGAISYFKYANFLVDSVNNVFQGNLQLEEILLPLGISFFTFQQISYLLDVYYKQSAEKNLIDYSAFVLFFPQLIAGPIVHHKEMLPQFHSRKVRFRWTDMAVGVTIFVIGLTKKVVFADNVKGLSDAYFGAVHAGIELTFWESWLATLSYTLQIYFDFSGYSDMAIGLARMFGIVLPLNFASPYKAVNFIEFWRRWHITLSRFLRDYLYIPLGGGRCGPARRYANLLITMLIGGLWHGAGWTFVFWGGLHGLFLCANHGWNALAARNPLLEHAGNAPAGRLLSFLLTFTGVAVAWVLFRALTFQDAFSVCRSMAGFNGIPVPSSVFPLIGNLTAFLPLDVVPGVIHNSLTLGVAEGAGWIAVLLGVAWFLPNTQEIMAGFNPALDFEGPSREQRWKWFPSYLWAVAVAVAFVAGLLSISGENAFLYFQF